MVLQEMALLFVVVRAECNITFYLDLSGRFEAVLFPDALAGEGRTVRRLTSLNEYYSGGEFGENHFLCIPMSCSFLTFAIGSIPSVQRPLDM